MWTLYYCIKYNRNQRKRNIPLSRAGRRGFWTWHWRNPIVSGIKCPDLGEWNLLGETAEFFGWPTPGRQANGSFPSDECWVLLPLRDPSSGFAPGCPLSCLSGSLYAVHRVSSRSDALPAHRVWWVPSKLPMLMLLFPMPRQHWRIAREDDDIQTDRGLVEGRLSALEVWWGRKPISITCSINSNYGSLCCSYLPLCLISRYKLLHLEWINNVVLQYSTGNYIQFPGISHNGKKNIKKNLYMYITESLYCIAEIGTTLQVNYISIKIYLPIFQIITMSLLLWKLILHLFFTPCSLDSCTSWSTERNLLTPPSKTEHAQGWSGIFGMTAIQGSSASIAFTLNLLLMLLFESNIHLSKLVFPMKT